jgi:hypothetical protein
VVDAHDVDEPVGDPGAETRVRRRERRRVLDPERDKLAHREETPIVDVPGAAPPVHEVVGLALEEPREAARASRRGRAFERGADAGSRRTRAARRSRIAPAAAARSGTCASRGGSARKRAAIV